MSGSQFCCCYHRHKNECILKQNLSNEIFRNNEENDLIEIYEEKLEEEDDKEDKDDNEEEEEEEDDDKDDIKDLISKVDHLNI